MKKVVGWAVVCAVCATISLSSQVCHVLFRLAQLRAHAESYCLSYSPAPPSVRGFHLLFAQLSVNHFWFHDRLFIRVKQLRAGGASMLREDAIAFHARQQMQQISTLYLGKDYDYVCKKWGCWDTGAGFKWGR